jgi:hypothetical protein
MAKNIVNENVINEEVKNENTDVVNEEVVEIETRQPITFKEFKEKVKIDKYIPINTKRLLIDTVKNSCIYEQDGMYYIDYIQKEIAYNLAILSFYTDFVTDNINTYDHLNNMGAFDYICQTIESECNFIYNMINKELNQKVNTLNSVGAVIAKTLGDFINKVPNLSSLSGLLSNLPKTLNKVNPEVLKIFAKELGNGTVQNQVVNKDDNVIDITDINKK